MTLKADTSKAVSCLESSAGRDDELKGPANAAWLPGLMTGKARHF